MPTPLHLRREKGAYLGHTEGATCVSDALTHGLHFYMLSVSQNHTPVTGSQAKRLGGKATVHHLGIEPATSQPTTLSLNLPLNTHLAKVKLGQRGRQYRASKYYMCDQTQVQNVSLYLLSNPKHCFEEL